MKLSRSFITPLITIIFLVVGLSGLLMFFHVFDGYTEVVHEILGLFFVVFSVLHVILNWKAFKIYFKMRVFILSTIRSEEHTSELQSRPHLVCRLLLEKKKKTTSNMSHNYYM